MKVCEVCGSEHEPFAAHRFAPNKTRPYKAVYCHVSGEEIAPNTESAPNKPLSVPNIAPNTISRQTKWKRDNRERHNAYMRDYMRTRRNAKQD